jgi:hypothetical protein
MRSSLLGLLAADIEAINFTPWTSYFPSWSLSSGAPNLGNGTLAGRTRVIGGSRQLYIRFGWGVTTTVTDNNGDWSFTVPQAPAQPPAQGSLGPPLLAMAIDNSAGLAYPCVSRLQGLQVFRTHVPNGQRVDALTPFTWAPGDSLTIYGEYEI